MTTAQLIDYLLRMDPAGTAPVRTWVVDEHRYLPVKGVTYNADDKAVDLAAVATPGERMQ